MTKWFGERNLFQKISLVLIMVAVAAVILALLMGKSTPLFFLFLALAIGYFAFQKELLWRVRNRLLVTYFLFGVVPIFLIGLALIIVAHLLLGQMATQRVREELEARIESVRDTAQNLATAASHGAKAEQLDEIRQRVPNAAAAIKVDGNPLPLPQSGQLQATPAWITPGFRGILESDDRFFIAADVRDGNTEAFAYIPLDQQALASLAPGVVSVPEVLHGNVSTTLRFRLVGNSISVQENGASRDLNPSGLGQPRGWWDVPVASLLPWPSQSSSGAEDVYLPVLSRPSLLLAGVTSGRMGAMAVSMLITVGCFYLFLEALAVFSGLKLGRTITQSVDNLYQGTLQVGQGDFSHQIPVQGKHQLSELAGSFNTMTAKIRQLIGEVKKKEKLEAEMEIGREVQWGLFPKSAPELKTLGMTAVCIPGRIVSGDYYDYLRLDDRWTAIALGDVSGKGVSAALVMASLQSALHAQLKFSGACSQPGFSTAKLMAQISQQLYENTPAEKYATFFCSVYDDETGLLRYTNAGHLNPILVRDGKTIPLEGGGMVAGLVPDVSYEEEEVQLQPGDLIAIFTDGISEAMDAKQQEFGATRLAELLRTQNGKSLDDIVKAVTTTVEKWIYDPEGRDDLTLMLLRRR
jgi:phosphoserine phosphatase RsbU/P